MVVGSLSTGLTSRAIASSVAETCNYCVVVVDASSELGGLTVATEAPDSICAGV